jgi:hypothetical protein
LKDDSIYICVRYTMKMYVCSNVSLYMGLQLPQPVLPPGAEVKPQPKVALPSEQTTQYKKVLDECTAAANANIPDVNRLQSCDQKMLFIQGQCDKHQMDQSICDESKLQDYINKQGLIYSPKPQTMPK